MDYTTFGIDVSKPALDIFILPGNASHAVPNNLAGFEQLVKIMARYHNPRAMVESTGVYHKPLQRFLSSRGIPVAVANPKRVRDFAKAAGISAKTDRLDARAICKFATVVGFRESMPGDEYLKDLCARRDQIIRLLTAEKNHREKHRFSQNTAPADMIDHAIKLYECQLRELDTLLKQAAQDDERRLARFRLITSVRGVGDVTAYALISHLPELGVADKRGIAALAGLAPMNRDSGSIRGSRHISGGRAPVRNALYMAALSGTRFNPVIREYYQRLRSRGKKFKMAITACMRKLLLHLNSLLKAQNSSQQIIRK